MIGEKAPDQNFHVGKQGDGPETGGALTRIKAVRYNKVWGDLKNAVPDGDRIS